MIICDLLCWKLLFANVLSGRLMFGVELWWGMSRTEDRYYVGAGEEDKAGKGWKGNTSSVFLMWRNYCNGWFATRADRYNAT